ncbi:hypothetical protein KAI19_02355 [bacterium]|nr:hypothetical protein [bacterium]
MKRVLYVPLACLLLIFFLTIQAGAHTPLLLVEDNEDGTISLEGGFSDGSSGAGAIILIVKDEPYKGGEKKMLYKGKLVLAKDKLDEFGELTVIKPKSPYLVILDAGPGHVVEKKGPASKPDEEIRELEPWEKGKVLIPNENGINVN